MEKEYKIVPFDVEKAKAGAEVVTIKDKYKVEILKYDVVDESPIVAVITFEDGKQIVSTYHLNGERFIDAKSEVDLCIRKEVKYRRMTRREFSWWIAECPEEHREWKEPEDDSIDAKDDMIYHSYEYVEELENEPVEEHIVCRKNGGQWIKPLIEI